MAKTNSDELRNIKRIQSKRREHGVSLDAFSIQTGVHYTRLSRLLNGSQRSHPGELQRLSEALDKIIRERAQLSELAVKAGLSLAGVRL